MTPLPPDELLARLHLEAVLPTLGELPGEWTRAARLTRRGRLDVELRAGRDLATRVRLRDGLLRVAPGGGAPAVRLAWKDHRSFNALLRDERPRRLPRVERGLWRVPMLVRLGRMMAEFSAVMNPPDAALERDAKRARAHVRLALNVLLRALPILAAHDAPTRRALAGGPAGLILLAVPSADYSAWIRLDADAASAGRGDPPAPPDARIIFRDVASAARLLRGALDPATAVGLGWVRIEGALLLADLLDVLLARSDAFLGRPPA